MTDQARGAGHTKGPWSLLIARTMVHIKGGLGELIASLPWKTERDKSNARLIAAAPDLLAALEALRDAVKDHPAMQGREYVGLGIQVNNAIAKAKGEA